MNIQARRVADDQRLQAMDERNPVIALWNAAARLGALPNRTNRDPRLS